MNKLIVFIASIKIVLFNSKIKLITKVVFLTRYLTDIIKIVLIKRDVKKVHFFKDRNFYYYGNHLNLLLDHIVIHLESYSQYYIRAKNFIDVGASFGTDALMVNHLNPRAKIYSFEPEKKSYQLLVKNCYGINKISPINKAVGSTKKNVNFCRDNDFPEGSRISQQRKESSYRVNQITLDDFIQSQKIKKVSLLKIDVEGYELQVLSGAPNSLSLIECLIIEVDIKNINHLINILKYLAKYHFSLINIGSINYNPSSIKQINSLDLIFKKNE